MHRSSLVLAAATCLWSAPSRAQTPAFESAERLGSTTTAQDPAIAGNGRGLWLLAWSSNQDEARLGADLDVLVSRSEDHGRTWSAPYALTATATTDQSEFRWITDTSPALATDQRGTWVAAWQAWGGRDERDVLVATSRDDGRTFGDVVRLRGPGRNVVSTVPSLATDGRGRWIVAWTSQGGDAGGEYDVFFAQSDDDGQTWSSPRPAAPYTNFDSWDDLAPRVAADGRGTWLIVWSSAVLEGPDYDVVYIQSRDDGRTWSDPVPLNADAATDGPASPWSADDFQIALDTDRNGTWLVAWSSDKLAAEAVNRDIFLARSVDNGATWSAATRMTDGAWPISEAPAVATDGRGRWVLAWSSRRGLDAARIFYRTSDDDGATFAATSTAPFDPRLRVDQPVLASDGVSGWLLATRSRELNVFERIDVTVARGGCGDGQVDDPELCDEREPSTCCTPNCALRTAGDVCRPASGPCDAPERCSGTSAVCGPDIVKTSTAVCRAAVDACDVAELCDGIDIECPDDAVASDGTNCGPERACALAEVCQAGECTPVPRDCDDGDPCTMDSCDPASGCAHEPLERCCTSALECDDDDPCTVDTCEAMQCRSAPSANLCPDGGVADATTDPGSPGELPESGCGCRAGASRDGPMPILLLLLGLGALARSVRRVNTKGAHHAPTGKH